jgi:hypothetical protein
LNHHTTKDYLPSMAYVLGTHQQEPRIFQHTPPAWNQVKTEIRHAMEGMKDELMRNM